jgi:hypothetical protein
MTKIEYLNGLEHRKRIHRMRELAAKTMTVPGFTAFSRGLEHQLEELDAELTKYERSRAVVFCCVFIDMKSYQVSGASTSASKAAPIVDTRFSGSVPGWTLRPAFGDCVDLSAHALHPVSA